MSVYFIQAGEDGPVKIGHATNVRKRVYEFQTSHHTKLTLLAIEDGDKDRESEIHSAFSDVRLRGEWFSPSRRLVEYIASIPSKTVAPNKPVKAGRHLRSYRLESDLTLEQVGALFGVNKSTVMRWEEVKIPAERVLDIERITGVHRSQLRPDIYPELESAEVTS